ncbi:hypothetical protein CHCC20375_3273 [Bacillus licheniformis]|nr:hypothetical protein CHCC20375_3273 [Bacillus licheniformis]
MPIEFFHPACSNIIFYWQFRQDSKPSTSKLDAGKETIVISNGISGPK